MVSIDLSKAFDTIDSTKTLIKKLAYYGCSQKTQNWFKSFFSNRKQFVQIENTKSKEIVNNNISVVQGSTCGPKMFSIYINDLPEITSLKTFLFADDTTLSISGADLTSITNQLNLELQKIADYFKANKLSINLKKSTYIIIAPKSNIKDIKIEIKLGNENMKRSKEIKFLGVTIDEGLTFKSHFENIKTKIKSGMTALCTTKHILPFKAKKLIYNGLIHSHISYCPTIWGTSMANWQLIQLQKIQKKALRLLFNAKPGSHTYDLFKKAKIMRINDIIRVTGNTLINKQLNNKAPALMSDLIPINENGTRSKIRYPKEKSITIQKLITSWKQSENIIPVSKPETYKRLLKNHIITNYTNECNTIKCTKCENYNENIVISYMKK